METEESLTRVTEQLAIRYPIIQGGMQWVGQAQGLCGFPKWEAVCGPARI